MTVPDVQGYCRYFRYVPAPHHSQGGLLCTPLMGETQAGRIYPVYDEVRASALAGHDEWEAVPQRDYDAQVKADTKEQANEE